MRIVLCAFDDTLQAAWEKALPGFARAFETAGHAIAVTRGDITALTVTAVVSPANSYGFMRGGVDLAYTNRFGPGLEAALRAKIAAMPGGLLPVGRAVVVPTGDTAIPYCVSAPTMERPMRLSGPEPVRLASRAATVCALAEGYASLAFPGMGTGTGGLRADAAAKAMLEGICSVFEPQAS